MSDPRQAAALRDATRKPCLLCGLKPYIGAVAKVGAPTGKPRLIVYSLCRGCFGLPDRERRVERHIFDALGVASRS